MNWIRFATIAAALICVSPVSAQLPPIDSHDPNIPFPEVDVFQDGCAEDCYSTAYEVCLDESAAAMRRCLSLLPGKFCQHLLPIDIFFRCVEPVDICVDWCNQDPG